MDAITRPRSFARTAAIAAISLIAAGFVTALGIGLRGLLWEVKIATAELTKAQAAINQAEATITAAAKQADAIITSARTNSEATIRAAEVNANGVVEAAIQGNIAGVKATDATNPALYEPFKQHTLYTQRAAILENELETRLDYETQRTLTDEQLRAKEQELETIHRKIHVIQSGFQKNFTDGLTTLFKSIGTTFKNLAPTRPTADLTTR